MQHSTTFHRPWFFRTPWVYRLMDAEFVDRFFATGELRLSSFDRFRALPDEVRGDDQEGRGFLVGAGPTSTIGMHTAHGDDAFVLCGSTRYDEEVLGAFGVDSGFRINDTTHFAAEIASSLGGFRAGVEGPCQYMESHTITRALTAEQEAALLAVDADGHRDMGMIPLAAQAIGGDDVFFRKRERYRPQSEYRFVWCVDRPARDTLTIHCPRAVQFCQRVDPLARAD